MPSDKNLKTVADLKEDLKKAKSLVFSNYQGLDVENLSQLRQNIKQAGGDYKIIKNTLIKISLKDLGYLLEDENVLKQPTALLLAFEDEISPIKALYEFSKNKDMPIIKAGFLEKDFITEDKVIELAQLPSLETLQAKLIGTLNSPVSGFVYVLKANLQKLALVLNQIKQQKEKAN
jgi:large subunit ribosomal protein L10